MSGWIHQKSGSVFSDSDGGDRMEYLMLLLLIVDLVQEIYIRHLKKEICLRDGTYKPKTNRFFRLFRRKDDN